MKKLTSIFLLAGMLIALGWLLNDAHSHIGSDLAPAAHPGPGDRITGNTVKVHQNNVVLEVPNIDWYRIEDTKSMSPTLDKNSHILVKNALSSSEIKVGDILAYQRYDGVIIHRVVEIGNDGLWYAYAKGDNAIMKDKEKIRFTQVKGVVVGILY